MTTTDSNHHPARFAIVVPLANEERDFIRFTNLVAEVLTTLGEGAVYLIVDRASHDRTLELARELSDRDQRFVTVWAPENQCVVDAYLCGFRTALDAGHPLIIEMDGGMSHDPRQLPQFLAHLEAGYECVFGSRYVPGGANTESPWFRRFLSRGGTILARRLLGATLHDMTSGYEAFRREVVEAVLRHGLKSRAHFYQTELRYLLRHRHWIEIPIVYRAPSPSVSRSALTDSLKCLWYYTILRLRNKVPSI